VVSRCAAVLFLLASSALSQQPNSPAASATWNGVDGPPWPIVATLGATPTGSIAFTVTAGANLPFAVARCLNGPLANGIATSSGLLDLDPNQLLIVADGITGSTGSGLDAVAHVGPQGVWTFIVPVSPTTTQDLGAFQVLVVDPLSPYGLTLTAATHLHVFPIPASAVYVSATTGGTGNPGTQAAPLASISAGIAAAVAAGAPFPPVFVTVGVYNESPAFADGVSVHGGLELNTWAFAGAESTVHVGNIAAAANGINSPTVVSGFDFQAAPNAMPGGASIACTISGSSAALRFENCRFIAQSGGSGTPGANGVPGANGTDGSPAIQGTPCTGPGCCGYGGAGANAGGWGGEGGLGPYPASPGSAGDGPAGGAGGAGGTWLPPGPVHPEGFQGTFGGAGDAGANAHQAIAGGIVVNGAWDPGTAPDGSAGAAGSGGGGGGGGLGNILFQFNCTAYGGSASANIWGGRGGGGGGGGYPGGVGAGGMNGGGSFAVFLFDATPVFSDCTFEAANGGAGGHGGNGASGGIGGYGAPSLPQCSFCGPGGSLGGWGGDGGAGGRSGAGAGGAGGPSWCVYFGGVSQSAFVGSTLFTVGAGGIGAPGGVNTLQQAAPSGPPGPSGTIGP
jgi:hypothetical protein